MDNEFYTKLAVDIGRVLTVGPRAEAMLGALEDPWCDDAEGSEAFLPPAFLTPTQRPLNLGDWRAANEKAERRPFEPYWDEILGRVKALEFTTQKQLAATYQKPAAWASQFKKVAITQKTITKDEWERCFSGRHGNRAEKRTKSVTTNQPTRNGQGEIATWVIS